MEHGHGKAFEIKRRFVKGAASGEFKEVVFDKGKGPCGGVGDEHFLSWKMIEPVDVFEHGTVWSFGFVGDHGPGFGHGFPVGKGVGMGLGLFKGLKVDAKEAHKLLSRVIGGRGKAEHGVGPGNGAVDFNGGADVKLGHGGIFVSRVVAGFRSGEFEKAK